MKISLLVPTRQRPERLKQLYDSAMELADNPELVELVVYIDEDDSSYDNLELPKLFEVLGPRITLSECWNKCWEYAEGEIFWHGGDDNIFRTKGWDTIVRQAFKKYPDKILFAYGDDGNDQSRANKFGTHGFVHKNWTDITGRFVPPYFVSDYNDTWFNDVAKMVGRHEHIPILIEHMHYSLGKSEIDQNTKDRLARHEKEKPDVLYAEKKPEREAEAEKLKQFIHGKEDAEWTILIATVGEREDRFRALVDKLLKQAEPYKGKVRILAYWNNYEHSVGEIRQALVENATGEYISFIDDDDYVPDYHVEEVMKALESKPDYVGWQQQLYHNGKKMKPTYHSLKYTGWSEDDKGWYRDISHLNPIKREIALKVSFQTDREVAEDQPWAAKIRPFVKTENYIDKVMYFYLHSTEDSVWRGKRNVKDVYHRPEIKSPYLTFYSENNGLEHQKAKEEYYERAYYERVIPETWFKQYDLLRPDELAALCYAFGQPNTGKGYYPERTPKVVYSIGCGEGRLEGKLEEMGCEVYGVDPAPGVKGIYKGKTLLNEYPGGGDTVIFCESIEHLYEDQFKAIWEKIPVCAVVIFVNWMDFHPIEKDNTGFDHVTRIDDEYYDKISQGQRVIYRRGSHLVMEKLT